MPLPPQLAGSPAVAQSPGDTIGMAPRAANSAASASSASVFFMQNFLPNEFSSFTPGPQISIPKTLVASCYPKTFGTPYETRLVAVIPVVVQVRSLVTMIGEGPMSTPLAVTNARRVVFTDVRWCS